MLNKRTFVQSWLASLIQDDDGDCVPGAYNG
jgi:hypothetical protein